MANPRLFPDICVKSPPKHHGFWEVGRDSKTFQVVGTIFFDPWVNCDKFVGDDHLSVTKDV